MISLDAVFFFSLGALLAFDSRLRDPLVLGRHPNPRVTMHLLPLSGWVVLKIWLSSA
jgi:hypothetical protein